MIQNILKRLGHVPSSATAAVVFIVWCAMVFKKLIEPDGQASMAMIGAALYWLFYKPNEPKKDATTLDCPNK